MMNISVAAKGDRSGVVSLTEEDAMWRKGGGVKNHRNGGP